MVYPFVTHVQIPTVDQKYCSQDETFAAWFLFRIKCGRSSNKLESHSMGKYHSLLFPSNCSIHNLLSDFSFFTLGGYSIFLIWIGNPHLHMRTLVISYNIALNSYLLGDLSVNLSFLIDARGHFQLSTSKIETEGSTRAVNPTLEERHSKLISHFFCRHPTIAVAKDQC